MFEAEIYKDEHNKNQDQDFGNFFLAAQRYPYSQTDNPVGQNPFEEDYASGLLRLVQGAVEQCVIGGQLTEGVSADKQHRKEDRASEISEIAGNPKQHGLFPAGSAIGGRYS